MSRLDDALSLAATGFYVFPCNNPDAQDRDGKPSGKRPRVNRWQEQSTTDSARITAWWGKWPAANIGIDTGKSGLLVVDIDPDSGGIIDALPLAAAEQATVTQETGGGGLHLFYRQPVGVEFGNRAGKLAPGIDTRGVGGYVVAPGSIHPETGVVYRWAEGKSPADLPILPLPFALGVRLQDTPAPPPSPAPAPVALATNGGHGENPAYVQAALAKELAALSEATEGNRNDQLNRSAYALGQIVAAGALVEIEVVSALEAAALAIGLNQTETLKTINSGLAKGKLKPRKIPKAKQPATNKKKRSAGAATTLVVGENGTESEQSPNNPTDPEGEFPVYTVENNQTIFNKVSVGGDIAKFVVADFNAAITAEITAEDKKRHYEVTGQTRFGRPFTVEISAEDFNYEARLKAAVAEAAGAKAPVLANMAKHVGPSIQRFTNGTLKQLTRFDRTGWAGDKFLIPGREGEGVVLKLPPRAVYSTPAGGDLGEGLTALQTLLDVAPAEIVTPIISFVFQGPLARWAGWREGERYALFISGQTGGFKSSFAQAAISIYGPEFLKDKNILQFGEGGTTKGMLGNATYTHDLPMLIDNYKPSISPGERGFYTLLHSIVESGEKERSTRNGTLMSMERGIRDIYTWPIFTGEDTPDKDPASLARLLKVDWLPANSPKLRRAQEQAHHLCTVGAAWIEWMESEQGQAAGRAVAGLLPERRAAWVDYLREINPDAQNVMRVATNLATNELTWQVMSTTGSPVAAIAKCRDLTEGLHQGLHRIAAAMAGETAASMEAMRFLDALAELIGPKENESGDEYLAIYAGSNAGAPLVGWQDRKDDYYLLPQTARKAVEDLLGREGLGLVSNNKLYKQLDALGLLMTQQEGRYTITKRINGGVHRVLHLDRRALLAEG